MHAIMRQPMGEIRRYIFNERYIQKGKNMTFETTIGFPRMMKESGEKRVFLRSSSAI